MNLESIIFDLGIIIIGAAVLGTLFLYARQPIIIAYIAVGIAAGPSGFGLIRTTQHIEQISHLGVILLLFLIGLNLQPDRLIRLFKQTSLLTVFTSFSFGLISTFFGILIGFDVNSALIFGAAMMFSSTVIGLKLIPTTTLHHKRTGEIMTSVLLFQDILAILVILFITGDTSDNIWITFVVLIAKLTALCLLAFLGVRYVMTPLLQKFDVIQEYTFVATLAWCLLWAEAAFKLGLSYELGAFVAGISIGSCIAAQAIAEHLKPLREFFLILFFFAVGAALNFSLDTRLLLAAILFGILLVPFKAWLFRIAFNRAGESSKLSTELAARLAQSSEFSLLIVFSALSMGVLSSDSAMVIQIATIVSFIISTYWVVLKHPTTIAGDSALRQD
ncbi:MAG: cation:proton antiporter [Gammaproteobacteria bacterium]|nr:cation:proton antiporter [Gammaproteobacteria bacterium]